jgi:AraC family transcriptional regulator
VKPKFEQRKEVMLAYIEHRGPYDDIPWGELMGELYGWAKEQKVMPGFYPMGIYLDDPQKVPREQCRSEIAISFKGEANASQGVKTRRMPAMKVATLSFKGPGSDLGRAYQVLGEFIQAQGHRVLGPMIEIYSRTPEIIDGVIILYSKIMTPVEAI